MTQTTFGTTDPLWKEITDYPNYLCSRSGEFKNKKNGHILTQTFTNGYKKVALRNANGSKQHRAHRIVAKMWLPPPTNGRNQVNHIDGNKTNNCVENLEWCSAKENMDHFRQSHPQFLPSIKLRFTKEGEEPKTFNSISLAAKHFNKALSTIWGASLSGRWNGYKVERVLPAETAVPLIDVPQSPEAEIQTPASSHSIDQSFPAVVGNEAPMNHLYQIFQSAQAHTVNTDAQ